MSRGHRMFSVPILLTSLVLVPEPGSTHAGSVVAGFTGSAHVGPLRSIASISCGLPCPEGSGTWSFTSSTDVMVHPGSPLGLGSSRVGGTGTFTGWCERALGTGTVFVQNPAAVSHSFRVRWVSTGTLTNEAPNPGWWMRVVLTDLGAPSRLVVIMHMRVAGSTLGNIKCINSAASSWTEVGVVAGQAA